MSERSFRRWLGAVTAVGLVLRLVWVHWAAHEPQSIFLDPTRYLGYAEQIRNGHGMVEPLTNDPTAYYPPGYPWFVGIVGWVSSPITDQIWLATAYVQAVLGAASVALAGLVAKRLSGAKAGVAAAVVFALYPNLIFHTGALLGETLYNFLFLAFLVVVLGRAWTLEFSHRRIFAAGVLLGLAVMVRPISLAVIPVLVLCWLVARKDWTVLFRWSVALLAGVAVCIVPWTIRNQVRMHAFIPISTNTGDNLCIGHADGATGAFTPLEACNTPQYDFLDGLPSEIGADKAKRKIAIEGMRDNLDREPWLLWRRTYFMWVRDGDHDGLFAVQSYRQDRWMAIPTEARLIWIADRYYWLVTAAGLAGMVLLVKRRHPEDAFLVGATLVTAAVPLLFFGDQRFKVPVIPLLVISAAAGLLQDRRSQPSAAAPTAPSAPSVPRPAEPAPA